MLFWRRVVARRAKTPQFRALDDLDVDAATTPHEDSNDRIGIQDASGFVGVSEHGMRKALAIGQRDDAFGFVRRADPDDRRSDSRRQRDVRLEDRILVGPPIRAFVRVVPASDHVRGRERAAEPMRQLRGRSNLDAGRVVRRQVHEDPLRRHLRTRRGFAWGTAG
jgi:hypothetical protein